MRESFAPDDKVITRWLYKGEGRLSQKKNICAILRIPKEPEDGDEDSLPQPQVLAELRGIVLSLNQ